ncbi:MAG: RNA polymerase factor sigma-54 [Alphaproteobacteria bacterium]|nr:RNA polymerase factor sigma-54 [Alphaproteobacteria bacterium]
MSEFSQRLDLRQSQNLVMTPQMQQAIKLLQMGNMELAEYIEEALEQNPLLEKASDENDNAAEDPPDTPASAETQDDMDAAFDEGWTGNEADNVALPDFDAGSGMATIGAGGNASFDPMEEGFESRLSESKTLRDHLTEQMNLSFDDPQDRTIGALLIDRLDESGYLRDDPTLLAEKLGCSPERLNRLLERMKQCDPTGIFARDLAECLALQLAEKGTLDAPMRALLDNLALLGTHDHATLAARCGVNDTYLKDMIAEIRRLNPKPAGAFDHLVVQTAVPDVLMKRLPRNLGGGWRVELNAETLPRVLVNRTYYTEVAQHARTRRDKAYLNEQLTAAGWLVRALDQRAKTILKVAGEIVEQQEGFFLYGIEFLRPMTLRDIAEKIAMHESTVSRVTTGKYIGTPRGLFELKFFFSTALGTGDDAHSAEAVKARIKTLIDGEDPRKILSDDKIVTLLTAEGIAIARRTVAKYREALHIPSSVQRRRIKKNS